MNPKSKLPFMEYILAQDAKFRYQLLDRLRADCEYYLGFGNRQTTHLWALDEEAQVAYMKALYNSFSEDEKPEWLSMVRIEEYARQMQEQKPETAADTTPSEAGTTTPQDEARIAEEEQVPQTSDQSTQEESVDAESATETVSDAIFEDFLCERNDVLDNAAYQLLCMAANPDYQPDSPNGLGNLEWNMALIGELLDCAEEILMKHGIATCRPFYEGEDEIICCNGEDCKNANCPLNTTRQRPYKRERRDL